MSFQLDQATKTSIEKLIPPEDPNLSQACLEFSEVRLRVWFNDAAHSLFCSNYL